MKFKGNARLTDKILDYFAYYGYDRAEIKSRYINDAMDGLAKDAEFCRHFKNRHFRRVQSNPIYIFTSHGKEIDEVS